MCMSPPFNDCKRGIDMIGRLLCLAVLMSIAAVSSGARAGGKVDDVPRPDPNGRWRYITTDDATSDSDCIGRVVSPMCALETYLAGLLRDDGALVDIAFNERPGTHRSETPRPGWKLKFRVDLVEVLSEKDIPDWWEPRLTREEEEDPEEPRNHWRWRDPMHRRLMPGDVRVQFRSLVCYPPRCQPIAEASKGYAVLRRNGDRWYVEIYDEPRDWPFPGYPLAKRRYYPAQAK